jgi:transketolase
MVENLSKRLRIQALHMIKQAGSGHPGGSLSCTEILETLFFKVLVGQDNLEDIHRDRFVLSKGHAAPMLYAVFMEKKWIRPELATTFRKLDSILQGHPDRVRFPRVEASTGSLGQGLSVAQGLALGLRLQGSRGKVYVLLGDGEMQEGQVWEALLSAPKHGCTNLCMIVDQNQGQIDGPVAEVMPLEPLAQKLMAFGWTVIQVDGHDKGALEKTFLACQEAKKPQCVLAQTVKGKGVPFMEHQIDWHGRAPTSEELAKAMEVLV